MGNVVVALLPCVAASALIFGWRALLVVGITTAACVGFEYLYCLLMKKPIPVGDLSAVVTGIILGLNMPVGIPLWIAIIGAFIAIVIAKQLFGGIGFNFANPALVGRIVLFTGFAGSMTKWVYPTKAVLAFRKMGIDAAAGATPCRWPTAAALRCWANTPLTDLFLGVHGGVLGETCALAILLGFAWLVASRTISPLHPPYLCGQLRGVLAAVSPVCGRRHGRRRRRHAGAARGAGRRAFVRRRVHGHRLCDQPLHPEGKAHFGVGLGLMTFGIRTFANMPEGVSYAILFMNLLVPYLNDLTRQNPWAPVRKRRGRTQHEKEYLERYVKACGGAGRDLCDRQRGPGGDQPVHRPHHCRSRLPRLTRPIWWWCRAPTILKK